MFSSNIFSVLGISAGSYMIIFVMGTPTRVPQLQPAFFILLLQHFSDFFPKPISKVLLHNFKYIDRNDSTS